MEDCTRNIKPHLPLSLQINDFVRSELRNWRIGEALWMSGALAAVILISIMTGCDTFTGIVSAATGIMYTLLAGKGKSSCYLFGAVNSLLYGLISFRNGIYGDMALNWVYYFPMQIAGLICWMRHREKNTGEVIKSRLSGKGRLIAGLAVLAAWTAAVPLLVRFNAASPYLDGATTVLSIAAMILTVMRCFEQWICWTAVNAIAIVMWYRIYLQSGNSIATLLMWVIFFICGLIFAKQWYTDGKYSDEK